MKRSEMKQSEPGRKNQMPLGLMQIASGAPEKASGAFKCGTHPTPRRHCSLLSLRMKQSGMKQSEPGRKNQMPLGLMQIASGAPEKASGASSQ
ncbi:MAG: hypothetical protein ACYC6E_07600 [Bellilinea sp.]